MDVIYLMTQDHHVDPTSSAVETGAVWIWWTGVTDSLIVLGKVLMQMKLAVVRCLYSFSFHYTHESNGFLFCRIDKDNDSVKGFRPLTGIPLQSIIFFLYLAQWKGF